ncbi:mpv17-like protein 2 [Copidosoma floridanum]|uniref:mpv17-like protein 2 n=1 Tax=Copidosoma floridanum TaxID=29053 RepID=UPI0006C9AA4C|nr:mpv17-like protein 2 [Copidosoma floridanum]
MGVFGKMFGKYLLVTNTVSCGVMMAVGDAMQQRSDFFKKHLPTSPSKSTTNNELLLYDGNKEAMTLAINNESAVSRVVKTTTASTPPIDDYNFVRTRNMTAVGFLQGPFHHYFYAVLERYLPGRSTRSIFKKTVLDQAIASPTCLGIFFFGLGALERKNLNDINGEVRLKLMDTWKVDCMFWPPSQFINFLFVPMRYRVIYINFMTMIYDMFLSYMKYDVE